MNNKAAISALQREIDRLQKEQDEAVKLAAQKFIKDIADLRASIAHLKGEELNGSLIKKTYTGKKRGRKPKIVISSGYPKEASILARLLYVIAQIGRFCTIGEIADYAYVYENKIPLGLLREKFTKHTYKYKLRGWIYSYKVGTKRNTVYGLPIWIKDDKVLEGREHDPDALIDKLTTETGNMFDEPAAEFQEPVRDSDNHKVENPFPDLDFNKYYSEVLNKNKLYE